MFTSSCTSIGCFGWPFGSYPTFRDALAEPQQANQSPAPLGHRFSSHCRKCRRMAKSRQDVTPLFCANSAVRWRKPTPRPTLIYTHMCEFDALSQSHEAPLAAIKEKRSEWTWPVWPGPRFGSLFWTISATGSSMLRDSALQEGHVVREGVAGVRATSSGIRVGLEPRSWRPPRTGTIP